MSDSNYTLRMSDEEAAKEIERIREDLKRIGREVEDLVRSEKETERKLKACAERRAKRLASGIYSHRFLNSLP